MDIASEMFDVILRSVWCPFDITCDSSCVCQPRPHLSFWRVLLACILCHINYNSSAFHRHVRILSFECRAVSIQVWPFRQFVADS